MTVHTNREEWVADLGQRFSGALLTPDAPEYDDVRRLHNGLIDKRPAVIARCRNVQDVAEAVRAARLTGLPLAVRGGGHNVAGLASVDAGIMIDLSLMKGIAVDLDRRTARVEGGVLWRQLNAVTQTHGLATTGGVVSTTGVAGLTLGGGLGWLMGKYGFALDNLIDHIHGAAARRRVSDTAFAHRREGYSLLTISQWVDPADDGRNVAWAKDSYQRLRPGLRESGYLNYLDQDDAGDPVIAAYGENYPRLRELKRRYDPGNLFRVNHNIVA